VSCVTAPKFDYSGFRLIGRDELRERWPELADETGYLAYE
jgi:predicted cupin superfamily sugar epimerase